MIDSIKEVWFRWRARVYFTKIQGGPDKRRLLRLQQERWKAKHEVYVTKYKKISKLTGES
jgi:hypothetical protein